MSGWSYGWPLKWLPMQSEEETALMGGINTHSPAHWWLLFRALGSEGWLCWLWHWICLVWYFKQEQNQPLQKISHEAGQGTKLSQTNHSRIDICWTFIVSLWLSLKGLKSLAAVTVSEEGPQAGLCGWAGGCPAAPHRWRQTVLPEGSLARDFPPF